MVCHVLLLEYPDRLVMVDAGFGMADIADPKHRIGPVRHIIRPVLDPSETAIRQIRALGLNPDRVTDILLTHLDIDHAGGLEDFPQARIHVTAEEARGAIHAPDGFERRRYNPRMWRDREITEHAVGSGSWFGFSGVIPLDAIAPGVSFVPLPGHTRGHAGVAVRRDDGWLLHAGDSFYYACAIGAPGTMPLAARIQERLVAHDIAAVRSQQQKLAALRRDHASEVRIICSHDPALLKQARRRVL